MMIEAIDSKYLMTKLQAARRLIHSATRLFWANEDPLASNLLAQSADQLTANLYEKKFGSDLIWDSPLINSDRKSELLNIVRKSSNFVKHADRDSDGILPVFELQGQAEIMTFYSILRFRSLSNSLTCHMKLYLGYHYMMYPDHMSLEGAGLAEKLSLVDTAKPVQLRTLWGEAAMQNPFYRDENSDDKRDLTIP